MRRIRDARERALLLTLLARLQRASARQITAARMALAYPMLLLLVGLMLLVPLPMIMRITGSIVESRIMTSTPFASLGAACMAIGEEALARIEARHRWVLLACAVMAPLTVGLQLIAQLIRVMADHGG